MQYEVTKRQDLLDAKGRIREEGWARRPLWKYDRKNIRAHALRIKEWDYYAIMSYEHQFCLTVTFSDLGYAGLFAIAFIDMKTGKVAQADTIKLFSGGKLGLSSHSGDHTVSYTHQKLRIAYSRREERRRLLFAAPDILLPNVSP